MNENLITVIPDVHGRTFWRSAVREHPDRKTVFLGDYLDPYSFEGITPEMALVEFKSILDWKRQHPDNVTLLLGNHDLGYIDISICRCRRDYNRADEIRNLFLDNIDLFDIVHTEDRVMFSHAGIGQDWYEGNFSVLDVLEGGLPAPEFLNSLFHNNETRNAIMPFLAQVSYHRGGEWAFGSCVWADRDEYCGGIGLLDGYYHVFGHTQYGNPVALGNRGVCIDCHRAFEFDTESKTIGQIK